MARDDRSPPFLLAGYGERFIRRSFTSHVQVSMRVRFPDVDAGELRVCDYCKKTFRARRRERGAYVQRFCEELCKHRHNWAERKFRLFLKGDPP